MTASAPLDSRAARLLAARRIPAVAGVAALAVVCAVAAVRYHDRGFLSLTVAANLLADRSFLGIVAVGMTFVIVSRGIDLSVGAVLGLSAIVVATLVMEAGWPWWMAATTALGVGTAFGAAQGAVVHLTGLQPFIVTLAGMFLARGAAFMVHLEPLNIADPLLSRLATAGVPVGGAFVTLPAMAFLATVVVGAVVLARTSFGRAVHAVGSDESAARLMGVRTGATKTAVYAISGACAAAGGVVLTVYLSSGSHIEGVGLELDAIAAVVVGGTLLSGGVGSVWGTFVGVLLLGLVTSIVTTYEGSFGSGTTKVAVATLLLAFVALQQAVGRMARTAS